MRITLLTSALFVVACTPAPPPPSPPPSDPSSAPTASVAPSPSAGSDEGCKRDLDCPIVMAMHQPCCAGRCSTLPPKADACPDGHLCLADSDCHGGATCIATGNVKTCKGGAKLGGPAIPGECINAAPNTKLPDYCSHLK